MNPKRLLPDPELPWPILWEGVEALALSEDCRLTAYLCPAGVPSLGWGITENISLGMTCTQEQADRRFCRKVTEFSNAVKGLVTLPANEYEHAAMVQLSYNIGIYAFKRSTVLRRHNSGDKTSAARAFGLFNKITDPETGKLVTNDGLTARRAREGAFYLLSAGDTPRAVAQESSLVESPIARGGAVTVGVGVLSALPDAAKIGEQAAAATTSIGAVHSAAKAGRELLVDVLGIPPALSGLALPAVLVLAGAVSIYWRREQRRQGHA